MDGNGGRQTEDMRLLRKVAKGVWRLRINGRQRILQLRSHGHVREGRQGEEERRTRSEGNGEAAERW